MARLQEQALHAGIEATTSLQFGMPGQLSHCPPFWQNTGWNPCELKASPRCTCFAHAGIWCRLLCGAERQTKCLVSVKKDTFASASNTHCFLTLSSGLLYVRRALPCMHACTAAPRKKKSTLQKGISNLQKAISELHKRRSQLQAGRSQQRRWTSSEGFWRCWTEGRTRMPFGPTCTLPC